MSKSNITEVIAILWIIPGLLASGWLRWIFFALAAENTIESMYFGYVESKRGKS